MLFTSLSTILLILLGGIAAVLVWGAIFVTCVNAWAGATILYCAILTELVVPTAVKIGILVYPADAASMLLLLALAYRTVVLGKANCIPLAWWLLGAIQVALFVWGLALYGTAAGVGYRTHFYVWIGAAYLATFDYGDRKWRTFIRLIEFLAAILAVIVIYRWVRGSFDPLYQAQLDELVTTGIRLRVIGSGAALMIGIAFLASVHAIVTDRANGIRWLSSLVFGLLVVLLQHRSVWVASISGLLVMAVLEARRHRAAAMRFMLLAFAITAVVSFGTLASRSTTTSVESQAESAFGSGGTFMGFRVPGWLALSKEWVSSGSPITYLIGKPYGSGFKRYIYGFRSKPVEVAPHDQYIHLLFRGGLIGLACFLWVIGVAMRHLWISQKLDRSDAYSTLIFSIIVALLLYFIPYGIGYEQIAVIALILLAARPQARSYSLGYTFGANEETAGLFFGRSPRTAGTGTARSSSNQESHGE